MLKSLKDFPGKVSTDALLKAGNMNLYEIFINMYLDCTRNLVKQGIKSSYVEQKDNLKFYKGKLNISNHVKYNFAHKERFFVSYDEYLPDRAENRLVKATLLKLQRLTSSAQNSKEINQLLVWFDGVNASDNYDRDFSTVLIDRNFKVYEKLIHWSKVFLYNKSFTNFSGSTVARALLFPMEKVYESYITQQIKKLFSSSDGWDVSAQDASYYLFQEGYEDAKKSIFRLRPDIVIRHGNFTVILDTKWKRLIPNRSKNYGISSADMYQMYAYSKKYTTDKNNIPEVWLLYPKTIDMHEPLLFDSGDGTMIHVYFIDVADENLNDLKRLKEIIERSCLIS